MYSYPTMHSNITFTKVRIERVVLNVIHKSISSSGWQRCLNVLNFKVNYKNLFFFYLTVFLCCHAGGSSLVGKASNGSISEYHNIRVIFGRQYTQHVSSKAIPFPTLSLVGYVFQPALAFCS